jgi:haloalkane dehalogenase
VAVDHIGCGLSDKPQQYTYTLQQHIDNLVQFVDLLNVEHVTLIAHDWGGPIGLGTALARPARFRALVLLNTGAFPPPYVPLRIRLCRLPWLGTWCIRRLNLFARAALRMAVAQQGRMTRQIRGGLLAPYDSWENRIAIDRFVKDIPTTRRHPTWHTLAEMEAGLSNLADRPCQLIWGMRDWCFRPSCLERLRQIFPAAEAHRLVDASHYVLEDAWELVIPHIQRFLASLTDGTTPSAGKSSGQPPR